MAKRHKDAVPKWIGERFDTLLEAARDPGEKRIALVSCRSKTTGHPAYVVCAVNHSADGSVEMVPFAEICTAPNPFEAYEPPK